MKLQAIPRAARRSTRRSAFTLIEIMIVVGIIGLLAVAIIPNITKNQELARLRMIQQNLRKIDGAKNLWALENNQGGGATPSQDDLKTYDGWPKSLAGETYNINAVGTPPTATLSSKLGTNAANSVISLPQE